MTQKSTQYKTIQNSRDFKLINSDQKKKNTSVIAGKGVKQEKMATKGCEESSLCDRYVF